MKDSLVQCIPGMGHLIRGIPFGHLACVLATIFLPRVGLAQGLEPVLSQVRVVSSASDAPLNQMLIDPLAAVADLRGRIYVADKGDLLMKVFDEEGRFLAAHGGEGEGPGEFRRFSFLSMDKAGNPVVGDVRNSTVTQYRGVGPEYTSTRTAVPSASRAKSVATLRAGDRLTLHASVHIDQDTNLFHVLSSDWSQEHSAFGRVGDHGDASDSFWLRRNVASPGFFLVHADSALFYSPSLFDGLVFRYRLGNDHAWRFSGYLETAIRPQSSYRRIDSAELMSSGPPEGQDAYVIHYGGHEYAGVALSMAKGVFLRPEDEQLLVFSVQFTDGSYQLILDVFDLSGRLVGNGPVRLQTPEGDLVPGRSIEAITMDHEGRFLLLEQSDIPIVRITELTY